MIKYVDINSIEPAGFREQFEHPKQPAIITDCFSDTPTWTLEYLSGKLDERSYLARHYGAKRFEEPIYQWSRFCQRKSLTFAEYAALLVDGTAHAERIYFAQIPIGTTLAGASISPNFAMIAAHTGLEVRRDVNIWLGPANHTEPLHFDTMHGTLALLKGSKKVSLFSPLATAGLYPFPRGGPIRELFSQVDVDHPDLDRFPLLSEALKERIDVVVQEGEALFIPSGWWHLVSANSPDYVCAVNRFWTEVK